MIVADQSVWLYVDLSVKIFSSTQYLCYTTTQNNSSHSVRRTRYMLVEELNSSTLPVMVARMLTTAQW